MKKIHEHSEVLTELEESCGADQIATWKKQRDAWQQDHSAKPDPYQDGFECTLISMRGIMTDSTLATSVTSLAQLKKEMAREEATSLAGSVADDSTAKLTASAFILQGIELEAAQ